MLSEYKSKLDTYQMGKKVEEKTLLNRKENWSEKLIKWWNISTGNCAKHEGKEKIEINQMKKKKGETENVAKQTLLRFNDCIKYLSFLMLIRGRGKQDKEKVIWSELLIQIRRKAVYKLALVLSWQ